MHYSSPWKPEQNRKLITQRASFCVYVFICRWHKKSRGIGSISALQLGYIFCYLSLFMCDILVFFSSAALTCSSHNSHDFLPLFSCIQSSLKVTVFQQLTADNFLYGAAHTTLAMPHHIMVLLRHRVLCNESCLFITQFQRKYSLLKWAHILILQCGRLSHSCSAVRSQRVVGLWLSDKSN